MTIQDSVRWLDALLELERRPVGIRFFHTKVEYEAFEAPENQQIMPYCIVVRRAGEGKCQKIHKGHSGCMGSAMALGLTPPTPEAISGKRREKYGAYEDMGVCRKVSRNMVYCQQDTYGLAVMPLEAFPVPPDVVLLVTTPFNGMRIAQGYAYRHGHVSEVKFAGMQAICQECTSLPYEEDRINFSMLCSGTRMLANWKEEELAVGMPYRIYLDVVEGLKATVNPLERDGKKAVIEGKLTREGLEGVAIRRGWNYDQKAYRGGKVQKEEA